MPEELDPKLKRLLEAVNILLSNAADRGECFVDEDNDDDDYPEDEDGTLWYYDWYELNEAYAQFKEKEGA